MDHHAWPRLDLAEWEPTYQTLHRWTQMVGKVGLAHASYMNHWWHVAMRVTSHGLGCSVPYGDRQLSMTFDFCSHRFVAHTSDKRSESFELRPMSVADFYERFLDTLGKLDVEVHIWPVPVEVRDTTPFTIDQHHASYDRVEVEKLHRALLSTQRVFEIHRGRFTGKSSPVHFFWGAFDLAVTRFSGRRNPFPPEGGVMSEAYSHEVISHGFWPGGDWLDKSRVPEAVFYAYALPEPDGFKSAKVSPTRAKYVAELGEFVLPYEAVRTADDPDRTLLTFMETTYLAAAERAGWDLSALGSRKAKTQVERPLTAAT
jgi:hypothetical protein